MIDHLEVSSRSVKAVIDFYRKVLAPLGYSPEDTGKATGFRDTHGFDFFIVEGEPSANVHFAFRTVDRSIVHACCDAGRETEGTLDRTPALAPHIHPNYYAGYLRDPDGRLVEFVCHEPEA